MTPAAWDTTLLSCLQPGSEALAYVERRALAGEPVRIAAPAVLEASYGRAASAAAQPRQAALLDWLEALLGGPSLRVLPLDGTAAFVAGRLRALAPYPTGPRKGDRRSKAGRRTAWLLDLQIAATAWAAGLGIATLNQRDFSAISSLLAKLYPSAPPLAVASSPF